LHHRLARSSTSLCGICGLRSRTAGPSTVCLETNQRPLWAPGDLCADLMHCTFVPVPNAGHELLIEKPEIRKAFLDCFDTFIADPNAGARCVRKSYGTRGFIKRRASGPCAMPRGGYRCESLVGPKWIKRMNMMILVCSCRLVIRASAPTLHTSGAT